MKLMNRGGRRILAVAALGAGCVLAAAGAAYADGPAASQPAAADEIQTPDLGMVALDQLGLKHPLDAAHIKFSGFIEQSFTANFDAGPDRANALRLFDDRANDYRMNQLDLRLQRDLATFKAGDKDWDWGFMADMMYGSDARFIHSRGLSDTQGIDTYQFDPVQFYALVRVPIGNGLLLKGGKFVTPNGAETIDPRTNALFSHSYLFNFAIPFTHTGGYVEYPFIPDALTVYYAPVLGWDVWSDNNSTISHMFGAYGAVGDGSYALNLMAGPESPDNSRDWRFLMDVVLTYKWTEKFSTTVNVDYGREGHASAISPGGLAQWYGVAAYATYEFHPQVKGTVRAEYFRDNDGFRTGSGVGGDLYEVTVGLDIIPFRQFGNLRIRPELRVAWDHSGGGDKFFKAGTKDNQYTLGIEVILSF